MEKHLFMLITFMVLSILVSCNKDQMAVNKLEGTWELTAVTNSDTAATVNLSNTTYTLTFEKCQQKSDGLCSGSFSFQSGSINQSGNMQYQVERSGERLTLYPENDTVGYLVPGYYDSGSFTAFDIESSSNSTLILSFSTGNTGTSVNAEYTFRKK